MVALRISVGRDGSGRYVDGNGSVGAADVAPVDDAGEAAVAHTEMHRTEVGVKERGLEVHQGLRLAEESDRLGAPVIVEEGKYEPFELRALVAVRLDPVAMIHRKSGRV